MPCRDGRDDPRYQSGYNDARHAAASAESARDRAYEKVDDLTKMLCDTIRWIKANGGSESNSALVTRLLNDHPDVNKWWIEHSKYDLVRNASEKLEPDELEALLEYMVKNGKAP